MSEKIRWGVISTAKIGTEKVIPAMQESELISFDAIASRNIEQAKEEAAKLGIPKVYGSYEELLMDPDIDAIYNPLPNHLHKEWTIKAMEAHKHVLCEKPLALTINDIKEMIAVRDKTGIVAGEAFMVRTHPQWITVRDMVQRGELGNMTAIQGFFSYFNIDPGNIRNIAEYGGGAMWDIGCYPINTSRFVLGEEPLRVMGIVEKDPDFGTDRIASVIMEFPSLKASFTVSTQCEAFQSMVFYGEKKRVEVEIPFNAPPDNICRLFIEEGDLYQRDRTIITFPICNQYTFQGTEFSKAIMEKRDVPCSFEDSLKNTAVILSVFKSAETGLWVEPLGLL
jgi:predicted dehydrogenase